MKPGYRLNNILWSLRKVRLPITRRDLVLDVGSGSSPHPAADVLLEKYVDVKHRYEMLVADRPTVLADACKMPFRDNAFDFIVAFHVLEHMHDPAAFLRELQRVGKAGYIETPNAIFERLIPYDVHLLEIMDVNGVLLIHKKNSARPDFFLNEMDLITNDAQWRKFFYDNPALFHVRHLWKGKIRFEIQNPEASTSWFTDPKVVPLAENHMETLGRSAGLRGLGLAALRRWYRSRKRKVDINRLLVCPECHGDLRFDPDYYYCAVCAVRYQRRPIPNFNTPV